MKDPCDVYAGVGGQFERAVSSINQLSWTARKRSLGLLPGRGGTAYHSIMNMEREVQGCSCMAFQGRPWKSVYSLCKQGRQWNQRGRIIPEKYVSSTWVHVVTNDLSTRVVRRGHILRCRTANGIKTVCANWIQHFLGDKSPKEETVISYRKVRN